MLDKLRLFDTILHKAELGLDFKSELPLLFDRNDINDINVLTLKDVFDICNFCNFKIKTYSININPYPGVDLEKFLIENDSENFDIPFFEFLRKFTQDGNFVSIIEEYDYNNFYYGKMTTIIYKGRLD